MSEREKFTEEQAAAIIRRAAQLQGESRGPNKPTVDLEDLQKIAAEAGIDPSVLNMAIHEQKAGLSKKPGASTLVRVIPGELSPDEFDVAFSRLPPNWRKAWMNQMGKTMNGHLQGAGTQNMVSLVSRNGVTSIEIKTQPWMIFMYTIYPALLTGFVLFVNSMAQGWGLPMTLLSALLMVAGIPFFIWRLRVARAQVSEVMELIAGAVEDQIAQDAANPSKNMPALDRWDDQDDGFLRQNS